MGIYDTWNRLQVVERGGEGEAEGIGRQLHAAFAFGSFCAETKCLQGPAGPDEEIIL